MTGLSTMPALGDVESRVLAELHRLRDMAMSFGALEAALQDDEGEAPPRKVIEAATRLLAARGLAEFRRGLFNESGETYGSGYGITVAGSAALSLQPAAPNRSGEVEPYHARQIAEEIAEGSGFWKACSGCQEGEDGHVSERDYPYNRVFQCQPGGGCSECGGLGVLWDNIDYDAMAREILADEDDPLNSQDDNADRCDVCLIALKPDDICASDIDLGVAHAACLAGSPVVDLESGEPLPEGTPILTYRYDSLSVASGRGGAA